MRKLSLYPLAAWALFMILTGAACCSIGCGGSRSDMVPVSGKVTYEGKVVTEGTITFYPVAGGRPSTGPIGSDGNYKLSSVEPGDGAMLGDHKVAIEARKVVSSGPVIKTFEDELSQDGSLPKAPKIIWLVPETYSTPDTSDLTATVKDETNKINFDIE